MMRRSTMMWLALSVAAGASLYVVKHEVTELEETLEQINDEIVTNQEAIHVLKAEWSYLNQPARLADLGIRLLGMEPITHESRIRLDQLDERLNPVDEETVPVVAPETPGRTDPAVMVASAPARAVPVPRAKPAAPARARRAAPQRAPSAETGPDTDWLAPILATLRPRQ